MLNYNSDKCSLDKCHYDKFPLDKFPLDKFPLDKCPLDKCPLDKCPFDKCPFDKCPLDKCPLDKFPLDKFPLDKCPLDKCPPSVGKWKASAGIRAAAGPLECRESWYYSQGRGWIWDESTEDRVKWKQQQNTEGGNGKYRLEGRVYQGWRSSKSKIY